MLCESFVEEPLDIFEAKFDSFSDCLSRISAEEDAPFNNLREEENEYVGKVLHFIEHQIVNRWSLIALSYHLR